MRLAHCSDLHLLSHDGARWLDLANKRWIGAMNLLSNRSRHYHVAAFDDMIDDLNASGVDHVLCTGDVTNLALAQEFAFARGKFDKLAGGTANVTVLPGNHDAYVAAGVPLFAEAFGDYNTTDRGWAWTEEDRHDTADDLHWPIVRVRGELAIVGISTSRATPWFTAYGKVGEGQLARLAKALGDPRLAAQGADLIVHGHEHRDMTELLPGPHDTQVPVRGVPSGTYCRDRPAGDPRTARYRLFEIDQAGITELGTRVWEPEAHRFSGAISA